ncbi:MAG: Asp-tRNA(Asn)/Glu-tRNA(Gln) amidotransferase GatCAB subunit C [Chloroflexi bacterium]|jgi:aspartyl-tRNA(Asn)/glutamyl-tRNA(Gln) amidotransferase subunit C|nr:Asp-tRNA(Asn)/Glu-tRNA(Gln) amidotransferase GatCAB subunit C [Chloroflexota bacterium]MDP6498103.1 Asp-tRNA(Asn)/Glu-tRNA(Gln) amidotransferase subunit GatC [Dehalococcoidia bacterium]MDP7586893.1 Asp-tRNA(Asn)/Glu-tRNA(Gln) amidotransferase subunit GatC [Dehalococcoidia bacterium]MQF88588.1 Asp-tRNA(Asn)/Glu-tRNA(Gln) amidotransferase subunit GatC [SAR202 cluster bacterium]MQG55238.1 Asp-tRNA(Asn)/Glu-tRNA(Gln) amidotransferase subunit GatC [SAR202 cluster bacterium]|tara:strand:+ start:13617 stop:13907 length:291 start_codon:yes stop_codon:yes gene_type:complete
MPLEPSEVKHIASLARIGLTDEEIEMFGDQLSQILEQFEVLNELDTSGVTPTGHAGGLQTIMRDDLTEDSLDSEDVLKNAPRREGEFFRVNAVLEE